MKKLLVCIIIFLTAAITNAQNLKLGLGTTINHFGINTYLGKPISEEGLGVSDAVSIGALGKYEFQTSPFSLTVRFSYTPLNAEGERYFKEPETDSTAWEALQDVTISSAMYAFEAGAEYKLKGGKTFSTYASADIFGVYFGDFEIETSSPEGNSKNSIDGFMRLGAGVGLGIDIFIIPSLSLNIAAKYKFYNLIGRKDNLYAYQYGDGTVNVKENILTGTAVDINLLWIF